MLQKVTYGNISGLGYVINNISQDQQDHLGMPLVPFGTPLDIFLWHSGPRVEAWRGPWAAHLQQRRTCSTGSKAGLRSTLLWGSTARNAHTFGKERVWCGCAEGWEWERVACRRQPRACFRPQLRGLRSPTVVRGVERLPSVRIAIGSELRLLRPASVVVRFSIGSGRLRFWVNAFRFDSVSVLLGFSSGRRRF